MPLAVSQCDRRTLASLAQVLSRAQSLERTPRIFTEHFAVSGLRSSHYRRPPTTAPWQLDQCGMGMHPT
ncbi:hypothetical protein PAXRUDRAFT_832516 [Paxillus rubicundulus Ve08.2h10]|uniref:Uncharacterized protein n=1 Tax=Paxillus rubicundulus Ve08.2h10 TaxID=930991 RepID=A0A0D0CH17_9AGAM|nr:hypothetical protein PAXRUDRAFT_832516 [Paxillus rubicundulus Ve08.2h10]